MMERSMRLNHLAIVLLSTILLATPGLAQTNHPVGSTTAPPAGPRIAPSAGDRSFGAEEPARLNTGNWMTKEQLGQWRTSKLEGLDVYNQDNEKIGDISEMLVDSSGKIQAVIIGVGGFLGIGERDVAIPFDQIKFVNEPRATAATTTDTRSTDPANSNAPGVPGSPASPNMARNSADAGNRNAPTTTEAVGVDRSADTGARSAPEYAVLTVNMTKDQLRALPEFKYAQ
jgi:sporulation protein YlmC with PRC-barrel domain